MKYLLAFCLAINVLVSTVNAQFPAGYYRARPNHFGGYTYYNGHNQRMGYSAYNRTGSTYYYNQYNRPIGRATPSYGGGYNFRRF